MRNQQPGAGIVDAGLRNDVGLGVERCVVQVQSAMVAEDSRGRNMSCFDLGERIEMQVQGM